MAVDFGLPVGGHSSWSPNETDSTVSSADLQRRIAALLLWTLLAKNVCHVNLASMEGILPKNSYKHCNSVLCTAAEKKNGVSLPAAKYHYAWRITTSLFIDEEAMRSSHRHTSSLVPPCRGSSPRSMAAATAEARESTSSFM